MSYSIFILGESGTGKTTSLRNLKPQDTLLIQIIKKPLPFRSSEWKPVTKDTPEGSVFHTDNSETICKSIERTKKPIIVIDDFQYLLANEFMRRSDERGFDKFTDIAKHAWNVLTAANNAQDFKRVYLLCHTDTDETGRVRAKTIGKLLNEKITIEGMVTIVLRTAVADGRYTFRTQNNGSDTTKSPMGLFDEEFIDNDLAAVDAAIVDYYQLAQAA